jgi:hypothetical protein
MRRAHPPPKESYQLCIGSRNWKMRSKPNKGLYSHNNNNTIRVWNYVKPSFNWHKYASIPHSFKAHNCVEVRLVTFSNLRTWIVLFTLGPVLSLELTWEQLKTSGWIQGNDILDFTKIIIFTILVTIYGVCVGNCIYWTLTNRNHEQL